MSWDPSMATTSCKKCGSGIEAWIDICGDCEEKEIQEAEILLSEFREFAVQFENLIGKGEEIVRSLKSLDIHQEANQMKFYLLNRMQNFVDGAEIFEFESVENALKEITAEGD